MSIIKTIIINAYIVVILVALIWGPLIALHGYRQWWLVTVYVVVACAFIGGIISRYSGVRRNREV